MKRISSFFSALLLILVMSGCALEINGERAEEDRAKAEEKTDKEERESIDLSSFFDGIEGCAVLHFPEENRYIYYREDMCKKRVSPFSTFKIVSALAGLENGVVENETSKMVYDGTEYADPEWNGDLTLKEAFQSSCIWYFRQVIDTVGKEKMQELADELQYGNCDISEWEGSGINSGDPRLNGFWLDSSLKISPIEQIKVMERIFGNENEYEEVHLETLKNIMEINVSAEKEIYGKTGSNNSGKAWFVGLAEENDKDLYFAVYLEDEEEAVSGNMAESIAVKIVSAYEEQY